MTFGSALEALKAGQRITRVAWNGRGMWLRLQRPDPSSKMTQPYLYVRNSRGDSAPWTPSHEDVLADDWAVTAPAFERRAA